MKDTNIIILGSSFVDDRGTIQNIINTPISHVAIITSKAGSIRSNHYHLVNSHYIYVQSGLMEYWERDLDGSNTKMVLCNPGDMIYSESNKVHKTVFLEDTTIITFAAGYRGPEFDKDDTVHMEF
jgi:quercetin dioxygenase-like cupin family protein